MLRAPPLTTWKCPIPIDYSYQINTTLEECRCALPDRCSGFKVHHTPPGNAPSSSIYKKHVTHPAFRFSCLVSCLHAPPPSTWNCRNPSDPSHYRGSLGTSRPHFRSIPPPYSGALTPQRKTETKTATCSSDSPASRPSRRLRILCNLYLLPSAPRRPRLWPLTLLKRMNLRTMTLRRGSQSKQL